MCLTLEPDLDFDFDFDFDFDLDLDLNRFDLVCAISTKIIYFRLGMDTISIMLLIFSAVFLFLYITGKYYLREGFSTDDTNYDKMDTDERAKAQRMAQLHAPGIYNTTGIRSDLVGDHPYATDPIQTVDDYEYSMIFQNEGSRVAGKRAISDAMSRYPMDWSAQPPSSQLFQEKLEGFVNAVAADSAQVNTNEFNSISGKSEQPPDKDALEDAEKKLLATYNPEHTKDLLHYNLKDTKKLVKKMYAKKGLEAVIEKSNQGTNVFEIVETKELNPTIVWEDDPISEVNRNIIRGENRIEVPLYASDTAAGLDPFFEPRQPTTMGKHDYTKWTPGLERSFAPTYTGNEFGESGYFQTTAEPLDKGYSDWNYNGGYTSNRVQDIQSESVSGSGSGSVKSIYGKIPTIKLDTRKPSASGSGSGSGTSVRAGSSLR